LAVPGMTLDWLYHGDERAMPTDMITSLRAEAEKGRTPGEGRPIG
jgi:hypothetical protein